jgi:two-component sensor histidine kinase
VVGGNTLGVLRGLADRLTVRLALLLSVALLPLGAVAVSSTASAIQDSARGAEQSLLSLTAQSVSGKAALIGSTFSAAQALSGAVLAEDRGPEACSAFLADYVQRSGLFSFAGFVAADGQMTCRSSGDALSFADRPSFQAALANPAPVVRLSAQGAVTGIPVVVVSQPILDAGALRGFMSVSLTSASLDLLRRQTGPNMPETVTLLNHQGEVIGVGDTGDARDWLPRGLTLPDLPRLAGQVFADRTQAGAQAVFVVVELLPGRLYALGTWSPSAPAVQLFQPRMLPLIFPALMWLASLGVALWAVYVLVLRHLRGLNRQMRRFALGQRDAWDDLPADASAEFREINATFRRMARIIARDEAEREEALAEKTVLLKEIHHRVKNNLQLIASIINLQIRELSDGASRAVLQNIQDRVLSMAAIHRALYEEQRLTELRADTVLGEIVHRLVSLASSPQRRIEVTRRFVPVTLSAERMVPLSLLLTEVLTNALRHQSPVPALAEGGAAGDASWIEVSLARQEAGEVVVLRVANAASGTGRGEAPVDRIGHGLGLDLIEAFAAQIDAVVTQGIDETPRGPAWVTTVTFRPDAPMQPDPSNAGPA